MKHLKLYELFSEKEIYQMCIHHYDIRDYTINKDNSIDVYGNVHLDNNELTELPLKFNNIYGNFYCYNNRLVSLKNSPKYVWEFNCGNNKLTSLEEGPKNAKGYFECRNNKLTSLKGCPEYIGGGFSFTNNYIKSFEYFPKYVGGNIYCDNNPIFEIWILFMDLSKIELFNDMDIIQDGIVILDRLNYFLEEIGRPTVESLKEYKYI